MIKKEEDKVAYLVGANNAFFAVRRTIILQLCAPEREAGASAAADARQFVAGGSGRFRFVMSTQSCLNSFKADFLLHRSQRLSVENGYTQCLGHLACPYRRYLHRFNEISRKLLKPSLQAIMNLACLKGSAALFLQGLDLGAA